MRYGFVNNFSQLLASDLAIGATTMTLDGGGALLSAASADLVYTLTLVEKDSVGLEIGWEIVHVTGATGNDLTIERGKEGTADAAWPTGSTVETRVTAGGLDKFNARDDELDINRTPAGDGGVVIIPELSYPVPVNDDSIIISDYVWQQVEDGAGNNRVIERCVALGGYMELAGTRSVMLGMNIGEYADDSVIIGEGTGRYPGYSSDASTVLPLVGVTSLGGKSTPLAENSTNVGRYSGSDAPADESLALGFTAKVAVPGGCRMAALPYLPSTQESGTFVAATASRRSASQVSISTDALDLTDNTAAVALDLPAGTRLFIDSIDVIITGSDTPGGSPEISVGPDDVTPAAYLSSTLVSKTAVGERQTHSPLVSDGVTSLRVAVTTAGTGTTYTAKVVFRGYVMEL